MIFTVQYFGETPTCNVNIIPKHAHMFTVTNLESNTVVANVFFA